MFSRFFKKKKLSPKNLTAKLNAKIQPMHRYEMFEDPLSDFLKYIKFGEITGGGTMQEESGEIAFCDIEIQVPSDDETNIQNIIDALEGLGAPKGSVLRFGSEDREISFGTKEGFALYLNGTDLPESTYKECDSNFVVGEISRLLESEGKLYSYWQGATETALYVYGESFNEMNKRISEFVSSYPLCQKCRIVQIA